MIKWHYFSKFLKLSLFGFLISFSTVFASSVDSAYYQVVWSWYVQSPYYNNYDITILKRWKFLSNYIWQAKPFYALAEYTFLFWNSWKLYYYDSWNYCSDRYDTIQWYFINYKLCDELTLESEWNINCWNATAYDEELVWRFLQNVDNWDLFYYNRSPSWDSYCRTSSNAWTFCFSSHSLGKSLCFEFGKPWYEALWWLEWSLDLPSKQGFWINVWLLSDPPNYAYIDWWSSVVWGAELWWDVMSSECTKQWATAWYAYNWYSTKLCYWGLSDFSTTTWVLPIAWQWLDVEEIRFNTNDLRAYWQTWSAMDYAEWFNYWRDIYEIYKKNRDISNPFVWVPTVLLTYFWFIDSYWLAYTNSTILEYCDLKLYTADLETPYTWINQWTICSSSLVSFVDQSTSQMNWTNPIIWSSWEWITDRAQYQWDWVPWQSTWYIPQSTWLDSAQDWLTFQNWFFNLLKNSFKYPSVNSDGALPRYIIITLIWLILFRFLKR